MDEALGCVNMTFPSALILKLAQLSVTFSVDWLTVMVLPLTEAEAFPEATQLIGVVVPGLKPQEPLTQACGNSTAITGGVLNNVALIPTNTTFLNRDGRPSEIRIHSASDMKAWSLRLPN